MAREYWDGGLGGWGVLLHKVFRHSIFNYVSFEQRPKGSEGESMRIREEISRQLKGTKSLRQEQEGGQYGRSWLGEGETSEKRSQRGTKGAVEAPIRTSAFF